MQKLVEALQKKGQAKLAEQVHAASEHDWKGVLLAGQQLTKILKDLYDNPCTLIDTFLEDETLRGQQVNQKTISPKLNKTFLEAQELLMKAQMKFEETAALLKAAAQGKR